LPLLEATITGQLAHAKVEWDQRPAVTVVMASGGYPDKYDVGKPISGLERAASDDVQIFHAGTRRANGEIVTSGGRVLGVTAMGETITAARQRAYAVVSQIQFHGCHYRRDIAVSATDDNARP